MQDVQFVNEVQSMHGDTQFAQIDIPKLEFRYWVLDAHVTQFYGRPVHVLHDIWQG